jgi:hypothetical protein
MKTGISLLIALAVLTACFSNYAEGKPDSDANFVYDEPFETLSPDDSGFAMAFRVDGNRIVDENGNTVVFRGLNAHGPLDHYTAPTDWDFIPWGSDYYKTMADWGATIVRLPVHPGLWKELGTAKTLEILDQAIAWCEQNNMYVIIDLHSVGWPETGEFESIDGYQITKSEILTFWAEMANAYADNKVVAFYEIFNEPVHTGFTTGASADRESLQEDWLLWKAFAEEIIDEIRSVDAEKPIIVDGVMYSYILTFVEDHPVERENIIYATHPYPDTNGVVDWDQAFGKINQTYPVFATELGFGTQEKPESAYTGTRLYRHDLREYFENNKISFTAWSFSWLWTPRLIENNDYRPTESGAFFRQWLQERK